MLCSLARPIRPYRTFLFVASQIGREEVRVAPRWLPEQSSGDSHKPGVYASLRRLPPHLGSLRRSCPRLVLCQSELSFGILTSLRLPVSHRGLQPHKLMPMTGVHDKMQPSLRASVTGVDNRSRKPTDFGRSLISQSQHGLSLEDDQ